MFAQDTATFKEGARFKFSGYADVYYQYDFNKPLDKLRPPFLYNFKKHNQVNINLALLKGTYNYKNIRATLGLMLGNYSKYNLATEPEFFRHIYEATIGYVFSGKISIDAGIFPSHIGSESAIGKDNWNLSRGLLAENSPYYETGIKFNYSPNEKWKTYFFILQGWQNIKDHNSSKAIGTQVQFIPNEDLIINSSAFIGNERPDSAKQLRLFHNFYITYNISQKFRSTFVLDLGAERKVDKTGYSNWMGAALLLQYTFSGKFIGGSRFEIYNDRNGVIVSNYLPTQFKTTGVSFNLDYYPVEKIVIRGEARSLHSKEKIFIRDNTAVQSNFSLLLSAAFHF